MELASNLAWVVISTVLIGLTLRGIRRGTVRLSAGSALMLTVLLCFLLLPVISVSDDLMEARQATLPLSAQTWHMASECASVGLEIVSIIGAILLLFLCGTARTLVVDTNDWDWHPVSAWLTRSQRLRPPPAPVL